MNPKLITILAASCGFMLLVIALEWGFAQFNQQRLLETAVVVDKKTVPEELPVIALTEQDEDSYADMVNRPLFVEGRKPVVEPPPEAAQNAAAIAIKFDWVLSGIYTSSKGQGVLLTHATPLKTRKETFRRIALGAMLEGWTLSEIQKDRVFFTLDGNRKELLLRKPKLKSAANKPGIAPGAPNVPPDGQQPPQEIPPQSGEPEDLMQEPEPVEEPNENNE